MQSVFSHNYVSRSQPLHFARSSESRLIKEVTDASFVQDVIEASKKQPVWVTFYASWCPPCHRFSERINQLAPAYQGRVQFTRILANDFDSANGRTFPANAQHFRQYGGVTYPSAMLFVNGQPQRVFKYYQRDLNGEPIREILIPEQPIGSPSALSDEEIATLLNAALITMRKHFG